MPMELPPPRPPMIDESTTANLSAAQQQERSAQTAYSGHLHVITFPDFMIEMFARQIKNTNTGEMSVETDEEKERVTALQLNTDQMVFLQQRLGERERHVLDLEHRLATAKDDIKELRHQLHVAHLKLRNATARVSESGAVDSSASRAKTGSLVTNLDSADSFNNQLPPNINKDAAKRAVRSMIAAAGGAISPEEVVPPQQTDAPTTTDQNVTIVSPSGQQVPYLRRRR